MDELIDYVLSHTYRGECKCGKCADVGNKPDPEHGVNKTFFIASAVNEPDKETFKKLAEPIFEVFKTKKEHGEISYIELGGLMEDQGIALQTMALGHLLGVWKVLSPDTMLPDMPQGLKMEMAGSGYVTIQLIYQRRRPKK